MAICGSTEADLSELDAHEQAEFLADLGLKDPGLNRIIRAEVYHYDDLMQHKSESGIRDAGAMRVEGKTYCPKDGDIMHFRFNV